MSVEGSGGPAARTTIAGPAVGPTRRCDLRVLPEGAGLAADSQETRSGTDVPHIAPQPFRYCRRAERRKRPLRRRKDTSGILFVMPEIRRPLGLTLSVLSLSTAVGMIPGSAGAALGITGKTLATVPPPTVVARYTFDGGIVDSRVAEVSGRGSSAVVRTADSGRMLVGTAGTGRFVGFPARCAANATTCPRALLEAPNDADLNPGRRRFRWAASIRVLGRQITDSSNIMQKGLVNNESQWKMQIGPNHGKVQCVVVGQGATTTYIARSSASVADGGWHRVICERRGTSLAIAVDGVVSGRATVPATLTIGNQRPLRIGGPNFSNASDLYHGWLDEVYAILD